MTDKLINLTDLAVSMVRSFREILHPCSPSVLLHNHLFYGKVLHVCRVAWRRASSHRSLVQGSYSVHLKQCSSSFQIRFLIVMAAGVLIRNGCVDGRGDKQPTCLEQSHYLMEVVAAAAIVFFFLEKNLWPFLKYNEYLYVVCFYSYNILAFSSWPVYFVSYPSTKPKTINQ